MSIVIGSRAADAGGDAALGARLSALENAVAASPEDLKLAADYRQLAIAAGQFDRSIQFLAKLAKRNPSGPFIQISLALAYVDKVPSAGDLRRLYLGRDAIDALTRSIERQPTVLAYYVRGLIDLHYNKFIFKRTAQGVADLQRALAMIIGETPPALVARVYVSLGDGYFRLDEVAKARALWAEGLARFPENEALKLRLSKDGRELASVVTTALSADRRVDTSLTELMPRQ